MDDYEKSCLRWLLTEKYHLSENTTQFSDEIKKDIERIKSGEPIDYIIGFTKFLGCTIDLSLHPLIPRPETEYWVSQVIEKNKHKKNLKILDLCCGSGCIGIACLTHLVGSTVDFVDISDAALKQTQINLDKNNISANRYGIIKSNLFENLHDNQYDLILTNPPYINPEGEVPPELSFEPKEALFADDKGLEIIYRILDDYKKYLLPNGQLFLEFGFGQEKEINKISTFPPEFFADQFGVIRYLRLT